jgi:hypothetical protein
MDLLSAKPEQRAAEANALLGYMSIPAMSGYVWVRNDPPQRERLLCLARESSYLTETAATGRALPDPQEQATARAHSRYRYD